MATITHQKTNAQADWTQPVLDSVIAGNPPPLPPVGTVINDIVQPSDWNNSHNFTLGADENFVTDAQLTVINNTSGTNTGDVTVTDSSEIDFTLTGQNITGSIVAGSIDETKLDASVNASLDLADSALQANQTITLSGDVTGSGATAITTTLATVNANVGSFGSATQVATPTVNAKGLITAISNTSIAIPSTAVMDFTEAAQDATGAMVTDGSLVYVDATPLLTRGALTGDITAAQGSNATTLATVNANVGSFTNANITVNAKGLITAASTGSAGGTPVDITVANEATDTTCFPAFFTAATGNLGPKTNAGLTFNSNTGLLSSTSLGGTLTTAAQTNITSVGTLTGGATGAGFTVALGSSTITGQLALANGGTGANLTDPNADRIMFWDDSAGATAYLTPGNGLTITTTTMDVDSASTTVDGIVELATAAETTTGTDATRAVTPDGLAGSDYGKRVVGVLASDPAGAAITTGDGKAVFTIPSAMNGYNLVEVTMSVSTVSSSGIPTIQLRRSRRASATTRNDADMLSTKLTVDESEFSSVDATTAAVIDAANDDVNTGDMIFIDFDVAGTGTKGVQVVLTFQLP